MKIKDVMTVDVLTVPTGKTLKETAQILATTGISGLIVVDDDRKVVGVISEGDILFKERSPEKRRGGGFAWLFFPDMLENEAKLDARTAGEAMSSPAITIGPDRPVGEAAAKMLDEAVNRLPVVDEEGELLGIVTRADLVRAFTRSDAEIEMEIRKELISRTFWLQPTDLEVEVHEGEVTVAGEVDTKSDAELLPELIAQVPGVVSVESNLTWKVAANVR
ncbi:MAG TPA: CBS domain-containing protein [Gaiellaceae bacterium]|nr:CBS domain-containing protein [Gaiellaceae bacterium]